MAQRKSAPSGKTAGKGSSSARSTGASKAAPKVNTAKGPTGAKRPPGRQGPATRPPVRKKPKSKSIVNQKQTPWGLIATTVAVVLFAVVVVVVVIATRKDSSTGSSTTAGGQKVDASDPYRQPELAAAKQIKGLTYRVEGQHNHKSGHIKYDSSPPVGGNHNGFWADCTGTVYDKAIANENGTHMLEHGAIWITYDASKVKGAQLTELKSYVNGVDRMALSPYPNLKAPISLQSWGYQLFVNKASDPRIAQFIATLKYNKKTTPEYGATCSDPAFKQNPSTFGHPSDGG